MKSNSKVFRAALIALIVVIMFNINGILYLFTGNTGLTSPLILVLSGYILMSSPLKKNFWLSRLYMAFFFLYLGIGSFSLMLSSGGGEKSVQTIFDVLKTILLVFSVFFGLSSEIRVNGDRIVNIIAWSVVFSVLVSYLFYLFGISDGITRYRTNSRLSGIFANPNELAAQSLFSLIFIRYLFNKMKGHAILRVMLLLLAVVSITVLILSFSRSIFLAFIVIIFFEIFVFSKLSFKTVIAFGVGILTFSFAAPIYYNSLDLSAQKRMDGTIALFQGDVDNGNSGGRLELADHALDLIYEQPFFGLGMGYMQKMEGFGGVHNAYLALWGNSGIFVLVLFIFFIFLFLRELFYFSILSNDTTFFFLVLIIVINGITKTGVFEFKINNMIFALSFAMLLINRYKPETLGSSTKVSL